MGRETKKKVFATVSRKILDKVFVNSTAKNVKYQS